MRLFCTYNSFHYLCYLNAIQSHWAYHRSLPQYIGQGLAISKRKQQKRVMVPSSLIVILIDGHIRWTGTTKNKQILTVELIHSENIPYYVSPIQSLITKVEQVGMHNFYLHTVARFHFSAREFN